MLHIACINNIAAAGFHLAPPSWPVTWHFGPPSSVYEAVRLGACDAALLPVGGYLELADQMEPIGQYGIGCTGSVRSVQLFSRHAIRSLILTEQPVYATPESKTSRRLLTTLCELEYGAAPAYTRDKRAAEGILLIGGEALRHNLLRPGWPEQRDLGAWWYERTGLPFVFARWVVNRQLPGESRQQILAWLAECVARCGVDAGRAALQQRAESEGLPSAMAQPYYARIQYELSEAHLSGERMFLSLQREHGAWAESA